MLCYKSYAHHATIKNTKYFHIFLYMPLKIRKSGTGYKVSDGAHVFSSKPLSLTKAKKQIMAINISKHKK